MADVFHRLEARLEGWPDSALTAALLMAALVLVLIALFVRSPLVKGAALAYVIFP